MKPVIRKRGVEDLTGRTFGMLTVLGPERDHRNKLVWRCKCSCVEGNEILAPSTRLKTGPTKDCGCVELARIKAMGHAKKLDRARSSEPEYSSWHCMIDRCTNPNSKDYPRWGAKGITVCDRWMDYDLFLEDVGKRPSPKHTIDRYPNRKGNYEPGNGRWATKKQQAENRDSTRWQTCLGATLTLSDWSRLTGLNIQMLRRRLDVQRMDIFDVLTTPSSAAPEKFTDPRTVLNKGLTAFLI